MIDGAVLVHGEGVHAGLAIFDRPGDQAEAGDHVAVDDVVIGASRDPVALACQDTETITEISFTLAGVLKLGLVDKLARRAFARTLVSRPV